jgi:hypothetical protein
MDVARSQKRGGILARKVGKPRPLFSPLDGPIVHRGNSDPLTAIGAILPLQSGNPLWLQQNFEL